MSFEEDNFLDTSQLNLKGDFEEQVTQLLGAVRLTRSEVEELHRLIQDVQNILSNYWEWRGCMVHPFGSIVTGLGIRSSDVDCFVALPKPPCKRTVYKAKGLLQAQPYLFSQLEAIARAKVPIVKCFHIPTLRHCDISFSSHSGVKNSQLLAYLLHVDKRVLPLAIIIKYWSKVHGLTGTNLLPNYSLTLMVIFFLQVKRILPSVYLLKSSEDRDIVDHWDTGFHECPPMFFDDMPKDALYNLLADFFVYYANFDFQNDIISPFLGRTIHKEQFKNLNQVPREFALYKQNLAGPKPLCQPLRTDSNICVQDPFQHCRNCSVAVSVKLMDCLTRHFRNCAEFHYKGDRSQFLSLILRKDANNMAPAPSPVVFKPARPGHPPNRIQKRKQSKYVQHHIKKKGFLLMHNQYRQNH